MKKLLKISNLALSLALTVTLASIPQLVLAGETVDIEHKYTITIHKLQPFLSRTETGNIVLEPPEGLVSTIDSEVYQSVLSGLELTNQMIDSGYLVCEDDFSLTTTDKYQEFVNQASVYQPEMYEMSGRKGGGGGTAYYGVTDVVWYWWGFEVYLDHWYVVAISGGLVVGSIIATLVPEPFASKAAGAILGISGWVFASFDTYGKGIVLTFTIVYPIYFAGIRAQK